MQSIFWVLVSIAAGYLILVLLMYVMQSSFIYHPQSNLFSTPSNIGLQYEDVTFRTEDQLTLHGWFVPGNTSELTVLFFHGNAGNISGRMETIQLLNRLGLNVFIFDYRGYGQSEGRPTERGTYRDATAAWNYLQSDRGIPGSDIVIMGRSLGGSVAAWLAARQDPAALIMESTFTSAADLGADIYPWLPVRWIIKYDYNTLENVKKIEEPIFMAHSHNDQIIPFNHSQKLFEAANQPKMFVELIGSHGSGFWETGKKYRNGLRTFLQEHTSYQKRTEN